MQYETYLSTHPAYTFDVTEILDNNGRLSGTELGLSFVRKIEEFNLMVKVLDTDKGNILVVYSVQINSGDLNERGISVVEDLDASIEDEDVSNFENLWSEFKESLQEDEDENLLNLVEEMNFVPIACHIYVYEES